MFTYRLEKKLRRSSRSAADAEEICEELDDIENCVNNHGAVAGDMDRLDRLREIASTLQEQHILSHSLQVTNDYYPSSAVLMCCFLRLRQRSYQGDGQACLDRLVVFHCL